MAEATTLPLAGTLGANGNSGPLPGGNGSATQDHSTQQTQQTDNGLLPQGVDPSRLPPEMQQLYQSMQGRFTKSSQEIANERKQIAEERARAKEIERQFQEQQAQLNKFTQDARNWGSWTPILNQLNQHPDLVKGLQQDPQYLAKLLSGRNQQQQAPQNGEQAAARLLQIGDDDYVNGAALNTGLATMKQALRDEVLKEAISQFDEKGTRAMQTMAGWIQEYLTRFDEMLNLSLRHQYGLKPVDGALYNSNEILKKASELGLTNLDAAYQLVYGQENARRLAEQENQRQQEEWQKREAEIREQARREIMLEMQNRSNGTLFNNAPGHLPTLTPSAPSMVTPTATTPTVTQPTHSRFIGQNSYSAAEAAVQERMRAAGLPNL